MSRLALLILLALPAPTRAGRCGQDECGPGGRCDAASLVARCDCDEGYVSVPTRLIDDPERRTQGATCVPVPARPDAPGCADRECGPHGVCVIDGACACDLGYRPAGGRCVEAPGDPNQARCAAALCCDPAQGACPDTVVCMPTPDGITCRCQAGAFVVIGLDAAGQLGPVCQKAVDPAEACGPEACGPWGECVVAQAVFCLCDQGAALGERIGSDGQPHPFCEGEGTPPLTDGGSIDLGADGGIPTDGGRPSGGSADGGCHLISGPRPPALLLMSLALVLGWVARRRRP